MSTTATFETAAVLHLTIGIALIPFRVYNIAIMFIIAGAIFFLISRDRW